MICARFRTAAGGPVWGIFITPADGDHEAEKEKRKLAAVSVKEFAELIGQRTADVVRKLMEMGSMVTATSPSIFEGL